MATRTAQAMTTTTSMDTTVLVSPTNFDGKEATTFGFNAASTKSVGLAKLAGKVAKLLWTQKGSNPLNPSEGTDLSNLYVDSIGDQDVLRSFVSICVNDAMQQLTSQQAIYGGTPEEMLASLELVDAYLEISGIKSIYHITISIYSEAGELARFELPSTLA